MVVGSICRPRLRVFDQRVVVLESPSDPLIPLSHQTPHLLRRPNRPPGPEQVPTFHFPGESSPQSKLKFGGRVSSQPGSLTQSTKLPSKRQLFANALRDDPDEEYLAESTVDLSRSGNTADLLTI